jgi:hypothetical protein
MRVTIIGGTGGMGEGLALRLVKNHDIVIGSRNIAKAQECAEAYNNIAKEKYVHVNGSIKGLDNVEAARNCDILILSIPYEHTRETCLDIGRVIDSKTIVVSPIVPLRKGKNGFEYIPMHDKESKSATEIVAEIISNRERIVAALHTISEVKLKRLDQSLDCDTYLCGDNLENVNIVSKLLSEIKGLRSLYVGPLSLSYQIEVLTPMLLNIAMKNKIFNPAFKII